MPNSLNLPRISLKSIRHLIDRVAVKYPALPKSEITIIIAAFFSVLRELLIAGNIISINKLFDNLQIYRYDSFCKDDIKHRIKTKLKTPEHFE